MNEKDFQSKFTGWLREKRKEDQYFNQSMAFELKIKQKAKRLNFKCDFQPQQLPELYKAKHKCVYKKMSDMDMSMKPFDCFQICHSPAYVVVLWYTPRRPKRFYLIDIDEILKEKEKKKSINEERAMQISSYSFLL